MGDKSFNPGIFEGCVHHKPRKKFEIECNRCLVRAIRLLADRVAELEKKLDGVHSTSGPDGIPGTG